MPRSPDESEYNASLAPGMILRRGGPSRRSKESGYESCIHSPVSPLKGPESLATPNESLSISFRSSKEDLDLNLIDKHWSPPAACDYVIHSET